MPDVSASTPTGPTPEGEFRVPEDLESERAALLTEDPADDSDSDDDSAAGPRHRRRLGRRTAADDRGDANANATADPADTTAAARPDLSTVDLTRTPGPVVGAVALGVVAAPLLGVYAVLFITRFFLKPGVQPDITSSWTGEGISGVVAAGLAVVMLVIVARAAGGRGLGVFVGAQVVVAGTCGYLLSDSANGGRSVTVVVLVLALAAIVLALLPVSRLWFAAHAADRAADAQV